MTEKKLQNPLTAQQLRFIDAYIDTLDPAKSAAIAGYAKSDTKRRAKELLENPRVQAKLHERLEKFPATLRINKAYIVKKLYEIVVSAFSPEKVFDKNGNLTGTKLKDSAVALRALDALSRCCMPQTDSPAAPKEDFRVLCIENLDNTKI